MNLINDDFNGNDVVPLLIKERFNYYYNKSTKILYKNYIDKVTLGDIFYSWDYAIYNNIIPKEISGFI